MMFLQRKTNQGELYFKYKKRIYLFLSQDECNLQQSFTVEWGKVNFMSFIFLIFGDTHFDEILSLPVIAC